MIEILNKPNGMICGKRTLGEEQQNINNVQLVLRAEYVCPALLVNLSMYPVTRRGRREPGPPRTACHAVLVVPVRVPCRAARVCRSKCRCQLAFLSDYCLVAGVYNLIAWA